MKLLSALNRRYAVKRFSDTSLDAERLDTLMEAIRLSPSAFGLQPYRLLLINNPVVRASLVHHSMGQDKVLYSSHLLVFAACRSVDSVMVDELVELLATQRGEKKDAFDSLSQHVKSYLNDMNAAEKAVWAEHQLYIALGNCLTSAALLDIDCCPMTGIDPEGYDRVLQLRPAGLRTVAVCALGLRHPEDTAATQLKVRLPSGELIRRWP
ncbi:nitroreductase family protein [Marinobacterium sediminicola]|uniref:Nitroreductase n=1 Tax=Marinobacterium sediminicola TaxID=518898 RepID=A0ABY1RZ77_9GAMM|nr:nitroreductase family protein [Marinobacterium sediminicola]ULG68045.1 nitroreductase family protein [Marinobacterium sediminicola]SMR73445.1 Nitroreductase [Marinobacterium sediminicola]